MKKSPVLAALPATLLAAMCSVASAQSSVTIFGTIDLNARYVKNDGSARRFSESMDGINNSQLGFRGYEDLGDGLRAGFSLISTTAADTGSTVGAFWNRQSIVSLSSKQLGEVRLGRDFVPTFWNNVLYDALGGLSLGGNFNVWQLQTTYFPNSPAFGNIVRSSNSIGYFLPPGLGGVFGQAMVAASEGGGGQGRYLAGRLGYAAGNLSVAAAAAQQRFDVDAFPAITGIRAGSHQTTINLGGSYEFGFVKVFGFIDRDSRDNLKETRGSVSASVPFGLSEIHINYARSKLTNDLAHNSNSVGQFAATYQYNFSKRTAVYVTGARLTNGDHPLASNPTAPGVPVTNSVAGWNTFFAGSAQTAQPIVGGKSTGFETGIRHFF